MQILSVRFLTLRSEQWRGYCQCNCEKILCFCDQTCKVVWLIGFVYSLFLQDRSQTTQGNPEFSSWGCDHWSIEGILEIGFLLWSYGVEFVIFSNFHEVISFTPFLNSSLMRFIHWIPLQIKSRTVRNQPKPFLCHHIGTNLELKDSNFPLPHNMNSLFHSWSKVK